MLVRNLQFLFFFAVLQDTKKNLKLRHWPHTLNLKFKLETEINNVNNNKKSIAEINSTTYNKQKFSSLANRKMPARPTNKNCSKKIRKNRERSVLKKKMYVIVNKYIHTCIQQYKGACSIQHFAEINTQGSGITNPNTTR